MHFSLTPDRRWGKKERTWREREVEGPIAGLWGSEVRKGKSIIKTMHVTPARFLFEYL